MKNKKIYLNIYYWLTWIALAFLWLILQLPHKIRLAIGTYLGIIAYILPSKSKRVTAINLSLCFPEYSEHERQLLAKKNFKSLGMGLVESAMAWMLPQKVLQSLYRVHGIEHVHDAFKNGQGALLITPHFTCVELAARFLSFEKQFGILYKPHKKPWLASIQNSFRKRHFEASIQSHDMRYLLKALRGNKAIFYAYDIDEGRRNSVFAPFFGIPTASLTKVFKIARLTHAAIIPMHYFRREDHSGYDIIFYPALQDFPSLDKLADATFLNAFLEQTIRQKPDQYVWQYKRFKTRPKGEKRFYGASPPRL